MPKPTFFSGTDSYALSFSVDSDVEVVNISVKKHPRSLELG